MFLIRRLFSVVFCVAAACIAPPAGAQEEVVAEGVGLRFIDVTKGAHVFPSIQVTAVTACSPAWAAGREGGDQYLV
ncbi:MAG: hypothetical protein AAFR16_08715 [Pseudomonadota bacterium]